MLTLDPKHVSIIDKPKPKQNVDLDAEDGIKIGMNFEDRYIVVEVDQGTSTILSLPVNVAYNMALKMLEATAIINFANSVGLSFQDQEVTTNE